MASVAPCTPLHALLINMPQQACFLYSLHKRNLVSPTHAARLLGSLLAGVAPLYQCGGMGCYTSVIGVFIGVTEGWHRGGIGVSRGFHGGVIGVSLSCHRGVILVSQGCQRGVVGVS